MLEILDDFILEGLDVGVIVSIAVGGGVSPRVIGFVVGTFAGKLGFICKISACCASGYLLWHMLSFFGTQVRFVSSKIKPSPQEWCTKACPMSHHAISRQSFDITAPTKAGSKAQFIAVVLSSSYALLSTSFIFLTWLMKLGKSEIPDNRRLEVDDPGSNKVATARSAALEDTEGIFFTWRGGSGSRPYACSTVASFLMWREGRPSIFILPACDFVQKERKIYY